MFSRLTSSSAISSTCGVTSTNSQRARSRWNLWATRAKASRDNSPVSRLRQIADIEESLRRRAEERERRPEPVEELHRSVRELREEVKGLRRELDELRKDLQRREEKKV